MPTIVDRGKAGIGRLMKASTGRLDGINGGQDQWTPVPRRTQICARDIGGWR